MSDRPSVFADEILRGQVAIVTGGGTGIGRATALELSSAGATVVVCGRRIGPLEETVASASEPNVFARQCDIRDEDDVHELVDAVLLDHGRIDLVVNNAGGQFLAPAEHITAKGFRAVVELNLEGTWTMSHAVATRAFIPAKRGGKIVSVTLSPHTGLPGMAHSSAARAGVENLMKVLAIEWARFDIKCNAVAAGAIDTETYGTKYPPEFRTHVAGSIPLGRLGHPRDIAQLITFLASPGGDYITGTVLTVDGGHDVYQRRFPPATLLTEAGEIAREPRRRRTGDS